METRDQLLRYGAIGLASNAALYAAYLLISWLGLGPKVAMSTVYCAGVLGTFVFNRRWAFSHDGAVSGALVRYAATYAGAYVFNMTAVLVLVDIVGLPHRWVVLALIFISAGITFLVQKFWVFRAERTAVSG